MGVLQDVINRLSVKARSKGKNKFRFRFATPKSWLRYSILAVVCFSLFTGSLFLLNLLEPYSNFGRFVSDLFRPVYVTANNLLVKLSETVGLYAMYPVAVAKTDPWALVVPVVMLALVIWLSVRKGRLYCNTVCPVGTLLGLVSKISLFKIRIADEGCNKCGNCMFVCKSQCIDVKNREVDFSRCTGCGNCIKSCDKNAIRYAVNPARKHQTDVSKRDFILGSAFFITAFSSLSAKSFAQNRNRKRHSGENKGGTGNVEMIALHTVTPPGSFSQEHFTGA
jgi:polyferredoxin